MNAKKVKNICLHRLNYYICTVIKYSFRIYFIISPDDCFMTQFQRHTNMPMLFDQ